MSFKKQSYDSIYIVDWRYETKEYASSPVPMPPMKTLLKVNYEILTKIRVCNCFTFNIVPLFWYLTLLNSELSNTISIASND